MQKKVKKKPVKEPPLSNSNKRVATSSSPNRYPQLGIALASLIPIFMYFQKINQYALNIPWYDDYDAILGFLIHWKDLPLKDKIVALFQQHNEHRILPSRIIYLLYYTLTGKINFIGIIYIANLQLVAIWLVISYFAFRHFENIAGWLSFLSVLAIFDLSNYNNTFFAMAGIQNFGIIMFFLISMYFYNKPGYKWLVAAVFFQFLCVFASGSGNIGSLAIVLFNWISGKKRETIISAIATLALAALYYLNYIKVENELTGSSVGKMTLFFFNLAGAHWGMENRVLIGIIICAVLGISLITVARNPLKIEPKYAFIISFCIFLGASIASIAVFRSGAKEGIESYSYSSRYLILPHLLALCTAIFLLQAFQKSVVRWTAIPIALILFIIANSRNNQYGSLGAQNMNDQLLTRPYCYTFSNLQHAEKMEKEACKREIYCRP